MTTIDSKQTFSRQMSTLVNVDKLQNSEAYLEECAYFIGLTELYQVQSTCHYNDSMLYCPIQVIIEEAEIREQYGGAKLLLQVWKKLGKKVYERPLQQLVKLWGISYDYFVYQPQKGEENAEFIHLLSLKGENKIFLIEDFIQDLTSSETQIKVAYLDLQGLESNSQINVQQENILTIDLENKFQDESVPCRLLGLYVNKVEDKKKKLSTYQVITAIETFNSQVDFSELQLEHNLSINSGKISYSLSQQREIITDDKYNQKMRVNQDGDQDFQQQMSQKRITKFDAIISQKHKGIIAYAQMKSGSFDIYFNGSKVSSSPENSKLFSSFNLIGTVMGVAHGKMISIYSILTEEWICHFTFDSEVVALFRSSSTLKVTQIIVLLESNVLKVIKQDKDSDEQDEWIEDDDITLKLPIGKLKQFTFDTQNHKWVLFLIGKGQKYTLMTLYNNQLYDITSQVQIFPDSAEKKTNLFFIFSSILNESQFILQYGKWISLFDIKAQPKKSLEQMMKDEENQDKVKDSDNEDSDSNDDDKNQDVEINVIVEKKKTLKIKEFMRNLLFGVKYFYKEGLKEAKSNNKEVSNIKVEEFTYLILGDHKNFYKIQLSSEQCVEFKDQNCIGINFLDSNYLYAMAHSGSGKKSGFRLYDLRNVILSNKDYSYSLLQTAQVGCQGFIDFSYSNQRIVFQANYEEIEVVPVPHRNTVAFIGMKKRSDYLASKLHDGKILTLSTSGKLYGWDILTGKPSFVNAPRMKQFKEYEVYQWSDDDLVYRQDWYTKILLKKKKPIENYDESSFYGLKEENSIKGQISYIEKQKKQFYEFKLIEIVSDRQVKEHFTFVHPVYEGSMQFLYFSDDLVFMYERLKYERHFLYTREDSQDGIALWHQQIRFTKIPQDIVNLTQFPFIFSPRFTKYLDLNNSKTRFIIRDSFNNESQIIEFPENLMDINKFQISDIAKRFKWVDENTILLVNNEGIERLIDISNGSFEELQFNFIPLYNNLTDKNCHYLVDQPSLDESDTLGRLKKNYQNYKTAYYLWQQKDENVEQRSYRLYKNLFSIDSRINKCDGRFVADLSFSYLHWNLIEQLKSGKLTVDQIDKAQIEHLFYNILPRGNTVLHLLHSKGEIVEKLLNIAHPDSEDRSIIDIHVPFLPNMQGKSPIHLCSESEEYRYINVLLDYLQGYSIDHHSRAIIDELHTVVEHDLPNLVPYLESRVLQTQQIEQISKGELKEDNENNVCSAQLWAGNEDIYSLLKEAPIEQDIKLSFLDIPDVNQFMTENGETFFDSLAQTSNMKIFETLAVKKLIEFKWPLIFEFTVRRLFIPFVAFLIAYSAYMNYQLYLFEESDWYSISIEIFLLLATIYQITIESYQLYKSGPSYFLSFWNYLDFTPPVLLIVFLVMTHQGYWIDRSERVRTVEATLHSTMSLLIWLKFLYFLRIFSATSYLIRIIIEVIIDIKHFLLVLLLVFTAFGDAMYSISLANEEEFIAGGYLGGIAYIYRMSLGDFDTKEEFGALAYPLMWVFFLLCTVFNMIIMLNLLIAIISESFARINEEKEQAAYQEKARFISENLYLVANHRKRDYCKPNSYLLFALDEDVAAEQEETIDEKLKKLKRNIKTHQTKLFDELKLKMKKNNQKVLKVLSGEPIDGTFRSASKNDIMRPSSSLLQDSFSEKKI